MDIRTYLFENKMTLRALAQKIGVNQAYLSLIKHGHKIPGPKITKALREVTKGAIDMQSTQDIRKQRKAEEAAFLKASERLKDLDLKETISVEQAFKAATEPLQGIEATTPGPNEVFQNGGW